MDPPAVLALEARELQLERARLPQPVAALDRARAEGRAAVALVHTALAEFLAGGRFERRAHAVEGLADAVGVAGLDVDPLLPAGLRGLAEVGDPRGALVRQAADGDDREVHVGLLYGLSRAVEIVIRVFIEMAPRRSLWDI